MVAAVAAVLTVAAVLVIAAVLMAAVLVVAVLVVAVVPAPRGRRRRPLIRRPRDLSPTARLRDSTAARPPTWRMWRRSMPCPTTTTSTSTTSSMRRRSR